MHWFQLTILVWLGFALIRFIGGAIIHPDWRASNNVFELVKTTWGLHVIIKSIMGTLYQSVVITTTLAFLQHSFHLALANRQNIFIIMICTAATPLIIPYAVYGRVTLDQYLTCLDESVGFVLIAAFFYTMADFYQTFQVQQPANVNNETVPVSANRPATATGTTGTRNRGGAGGDRVGGVGLRSSTNPESTATRQLELERAEKLREFAFYTFLVSLPLVLFWDVYLQTAA